MHTSKKEKDSRNQRVREREPQLRAMLETAQMAIVPATATSLDDLSPKVMKKKTAAVRATLKEQARCLKAKIMKMIAKARLPLVKRTSQCAGTSCTEKEDAKEETTATFSIPRM